MTRTTVPSTGPSTGSRARTGQNSLPPHPEVGPTDAARPAPGSAAPTVGTRTVVLRAARAELLKVRTLRSTRVAVLVAVVSLVLFAVFMAVGSVVQTVPTDPALSAADVVLGATTSGVNVAFYAVATLGVIMVTGEYATGTIGSTLASVPRRGVLLAGKAVAVATVTFATTLVATGLALVGVGVVLASGGLATATDPGLTVRVVVGTALYLSVVALIGSGFGWLLRSTAGALASLIGLLVVLPALAFLLPASVARVVRPFLPDVAGAAVYQPVPDMIGTWTGFAVFTAYAVVVSAFAMAAVRRRDG